jgi:hypothetical protein
MDRVGRRHVVVTTGGAEFGQLPALISAEIPAGVMELPFAVAAL